MPNYELGFTKPDDVWYTEDGKVGDYQFKPGWYFWDETGGECGPFPTKEAGETAFKEHLKMLNPEDFDV